MKDWRGGRAASFNIIPSSTGAAKVLNLTGINPFLLKSNSLFIYLIIKMILSYMCVGCWESLTSTKWEIDRNVI